MSSFHVAFTVQRFNLKPSPFATCQSDRLISCTRPPESRLSDRKSHGRTPRPSSYIAVASSMPAGRRSRSRRSPPPLPAPSPELLMKAPISASISSFFRNNKSCFLMYFFPLLVLFLLIAYSAYRGFGFIQVDESLKNEYGAYTYKIVNEYDHDPRAFTQGLVYAGNDTFYESTGLYGSSSVRRVRVPTGEVLKLYRMENQYFGEGLTLFNHRLYQVAWKVKFGFIYDEDTLSLLGKFKHPMKDGWGLATDGKVLYGSDGSSTIYVMKPSSFKEEKRFTVKDGDKEIQLLNELEFVGNELWANVWMTDCIVRISPSNGGVLGWILLHKLRSNLLAKGNNFIDVLNGIAWDAADDRIFVTGKDWPKLYEIKLHQDGSLKEKQDIWRRCGV